MSARRRRWAAVGVLAAIAAALAATAPGAVASQPRRVERVLIVSLPRVRWADVADVRPPALLGLLARSAVASASVRTIGARTSLAEGYATIGAGNRAGVEEANAGLAMGPEVPYEGGRAGDAFARRSGVRASGDVLHLGIARVEARNRRLLYEAEPGTLGTALGEAGLRTAVVGNADVARSPDPTALHRELALALMDRTGQVDAGNVDAGLLRDDPVAPFGLRLDEAAVAQAFDDAWRTADVVLLEASDLERADAYASLATADAAAAAARRALRHSDRLVEQALRHVDLATDLVIVVAPAAPRAEEALTVAAVAGPGFEPGQARSATTRRHGYVTLTDIGPTILDAFGLELPDEMSGTAIASAGGDAFDAATARDLADDNDRTVFRDEATGPVSVTFIVFQVLTYALAVVALLLGRHYRRLHDAVTFMALMTLAVPPVVFLSGLTAYHELGVAGFVAAVFGVAASLAAVARQLGRRNPVHAPLLLVGLGLLVLLGDVASGANLQLNTVFGYSPIVAGRFAGYGNLAFALAAVSAIVAATALWANTAGEGRAQARTVLVGLAALFTVVVVADGHPSLGSDVGGVLATVPAFAVVVLLLAGVRVDWRRGLVIAGGTLAVLAAFAAVDLARPADDRTHLGRLLARATDGGSDSLVTTLQRKVESNVNILTSSVWSYVIPVAFAFLAFLIWRPQGFLRHLIDTVPGLRACLVGALVAGVLGFALNDSGVAIPAMMLAVLLPYLTVLVMRTGPPPESQRPLRESGP